MIVSAPPRALNATVSTSLVSMVMLATSRKNRRRLPLAARSMFSAAPAPLKRIVSLPDCPSMVSLPSPGSQTNVSSPAPMSARSLPRLPSIESLPGPPRSRSAPAPPARVSLPKPPSSSVGMTSVNAPLASSMRTRSSPARASTTILATYLRRTLKSAEPSSPTSIWRTSGRPALRRSAILSAVRLPMTTRVPCLSVGVLKKPCRWCDEALAVVLVAAASAGAAAIAPPAMAAATTAAAAATRAGRAARVPSGRG